MISFDSLFNKNLNKHKDNSRRDYYEKSVTCDFCKDTFTVLKEKTRFWRRACKKYECKIQQERERNSFKRKHGRSPSYLDRETTSNMSILEVIELQQKTLQGL